MTTDQIAALGCWRNDIECVPFAGGITNENYLVCDGSSRFVVRICADRHFPAIDRRNEYVCQQAAYKAGVSPEIVHRKLGILVSGYVEPRTLCDENLHDAVKLRRLAMILRGLHALRDRLIGEMFFFCPFQTVRTYADAIGRLRARQPRDIANFLDVAQRLSHEITAYAPTLCHNDLLAADILDDGEKHWLVD